MKYMQNVKARPFTEGRTPAPKADPKTKIDESKPEDESVDEAAKVLTKAEKKMVDKLSKAIGGSTNGVQVNNFDTANQAAVKKVFDAVEKAKSALEKLGSYQVSG